MTAGSAGGGEPRAQRPSTSEAAILEILNSEQSTAAEWVDPPSATALAQGDGDEQSKDWRWVEEWRAGREAVPWGPGVAVGGFTACLVAAAVYVLTAGLADQPIIAIVVDVVVAAGITPAIWLARDLPVLRWVAGGAAVGVLIAWVSALIFLL